MIEPDWEAIARRCEANPILLRREVELLLESQRLAAYADGIEFVYERAEAEIS